MGPIRAEVVLDAPRERAFEFLCDLANRPAFCDHFISDLRLSRIDAAGLGAGARFRCEGMPAGGWMDTRIVEVDPLKRIVERGHGGPSNRLEADVVWELSGGAGGLTQVRLIFWTRPSNPADRVAEALRGGSSRQRRNWGRALRRLRDLLESPGTEHARVTVGGRSRVPTLAR